jgi:hypothetical protein
MPVQSPLKDVVLALKASFASARHRPCEGSASTLLHVNHLYSYISTRIATQDASYARLAYRRSIRNDSCVTSLAIS